MVGAHRKGHKVFFLPDGGTLVDGDTLHFYVRDITPQYNELQPFIDNGTKVIPIGKSYRDNLMDDLNLISK